MNVDAQARAAGAYLLPPPGDARRLSRWAYRRRCVAEAAAVLAQRRPSQASLIHYERRWTRHAALARWRDAPDVDRAVRLSSYGDRILGALIDFEPYAIRAPSFFGWRAELLAAILGRHAPLDEGIVEVGCGLGKNLVALARHGFSALAGFDGVPAAVEAVREQAMRFALPIEAGIWDLRDPPPPAAAALAHGATVLTNYVLEQFPTELDRAVDAIASLHPRQVLCIEPSTLRPAGHTLRLELAVSALHARRRGYHTDIVGGLRALERRGRLTIREVVPLGFSPHLTHSPALVRWSPA